MAKQVATGAAQAVSQVSLITIALTWAAADTVTIKIGGKKVVYVAVGSNTTDIATGLAAACAAATSQEFKEITWTSAVNVVTATGTAGKPFTMTSVEVTAGTGTAVVSSSVVATGPYHWDNADNWLSGSVPAGADEVYIIDPAIRLMYGLPTSITFAKFVHKRGQVGLPDINEGGYPEYRTRRAVFTCLAVEIGESNGVGPTLCRIDLAAGASVVAIFGSGTQTVGAAVDMLMNNVAATVAVIAGQFGLAIGGNETSTVGTIRVSKQGSCAIGQATTITTLVSAGNTNLYANITNATCEDNTLTVLGTATITNLTVKGGSCVHKSSGTFTTVVVGPGLLDCSQDNRTRTITNLQLKLGGRFSDQYNSLTLTNGVTLGTDADMLTAS